MSFFVSVVPFLRRLHFYAGILVAPFLIVATISGAIYALAPSIEQLAYRDYLHAQTDGPPVAVSQQVNAARAVLPGLTPTAVQPGSEATTTRVLFDDPTLGDSERRAVFVDPATARPQGTLVVYGSSGALPFRTWIDQLHRSLHLGEPGRLYSEIAASWLWVIALGGLALWVNRFQKRRRAGHPARLLAIERRRGSGRTLDWHGVVGVWLVVGLVFLSVTGLTWSRYAGENVSDLRTALSWNAPSLDAQAAGHSSNSVSTNISRLDAVLASARGAGLDGVVEASIPTDTMTPYEVAQSRVAWQFSRSSVAIDGSTLAVVDSVRFADWPFVAKLAEWGIQLHMGILFGLVSQLALFALCVALLTVIVRGYLMWWRRRSGSSLAGAAPASGTWRKVPVPVVAGIVVVAAVIGWYLPLFGIPLLAFLVVDAAVRAVSAR